MNHLRKATFGNSSVVHVLSIFGGSLCGLSAAGASKCDHPASCRRCLEIAAGNDRAIARATNAEGPSRPTPAAKQNALPLAFAGDPVQMTLF